MFLPPFFFFFEARGSGRRQMTNSPDFFVLDPPSYLSISHIQSRVTLATAWNRAGTVSLEPTQPGRGGGQLADHCCSQMVGSMDAVASLQPQEVTCCLITCHLPCTSSRLCNLRLDEILRLTLPRQVVSLWCVCPVGGREKRQGYLPAVIQDCFPLPCLSASNGGIFSSRDSALPASWKTSWAYILRKGLYSPHSLQSVKHSGCLWQVWNWSRAYFISLVNCYSPGCYFIITSLCVLWLEEISVCC